MDRWLFWVAFLVIGSGAVAAQSVGFTVSGVLRDAASGETLLGATVWCEDVATGASTNNYGFYSLTLPHGTHVLTFSFIGYQPEQIEVSASGRLDVALRAGLVLEEAPQSGRFQKGIAGFIFSQVGKVFQ